VRKTPECLRRAIIACLLTMPIVAMAQGITPSLPNVGEIRDVGRLKVFVSLRGSTWFLPTAFSSSLNCLESSGAKNRLCTLTVINALQDNEKDGLSRVGDTVGGAVTHFTDVEPFVKKIDEAFRGLPAFVTAAPFLLKTLRLGRPNLQYASITQRFSSNQAEELLAAYGQNGIGEFVSTVDFNAERTSGFVALRDPSELIKRLRQLAPEFAIEDVHTAIHDSLDAQIIANRNVDLDSGKVLVEFFVRGHCLKLNTNGTYSLKGAPEECLTKPTIVFDETVSPVAAQCTATLPLKEGGKVFSTCAGR